LFTAVALIRWRWGWPRALALAAILLAVDLSFWSANIIKVPDGGWFPLVVGAVVFTMMTTWKKGRTVLAERLRKGSVSFDAFAEQLEREKFLRVPGTAVFMYSDPAATPPALLHNLKHNKVLHERVLL